MRAKTGDSNRKRGEDQVEKLSQSRRKRQRDGNREEKVIDEYQSCER